MTDQQRLPLEGPICWRCPVRTQCGAEFGPKACPPSHGLPMFGGVEALHIDNPAFAELIGLLGGLQLDDIVAQPIALPSLDQFVALIRTRSALVGQLRASVYAVSASTVIGRRRTVLKAQQLRSLVGLPPGTPIICQLFGPDPVLERLWAERETLLPQLARAGYSVICSPSYSLWEPRPRSEHLVNVRRSLLVFQELQRLGAPSIPRFAAAVQADVHRFAAWVNANPAVTAIAVDLGTYRSSSASREQFDFLGFLDDLTGRRLHFWVSGPSTASRWGGVVKAVSPTRVTITNGRLISAPPGTNSDFATRERSTRRAVAARAIEVLGMNSVEQNTVVPVRTIGNG